jgi:hypothetical protein
MAASRLLSSQEEEVAEEAVTPHLLVKIKLVEYHFL